MEKKKIKDLTLEEILNFCRKGCKCCPLTNTSICEEVDINLTKEELNSEIEVEEDKPQKCKDLRGCC